MPRPQRALDPAGGPLVEFARGLRELRAAAGTPKFTTMARRTGRSKTALADASAGQHLPRWETVEDFVRACDADPAPWRARWEALRAGSDAGATTVPGSAGEPGAEPGTEPGAEPGAPPPTAEPGLAPPVTPTPPAPPAPPPGSSEAPGPGGRRRRAVAAALALVVVVGGVSFGLGRASTTPPRPVPQTVEAIEIQNKVALGYDELVEDSTPIYLSTQTISYCASPSRSCKVPGTEMWSGVAIVASCWTTGQRMWNVNLSDPRSDDNPDRAESDLWYRASFPDGRTGYISEVYITRGDRGGRGLPQCAT